jgi:hypothetical protein
MGFNRRRHELLTGEIVYPEYGWRTFSDSVEYYF